MCGICGIVNFDNQPVTGAPVLTMMHYMKRRGPDDEGIYLKDQIGLGFVRLSIIDLSIAGHQPMISKDGRYVIIFNGEIYNYIELKAKLKGFYSFVSNTDTEVLLASYIKWGESCLDMLNGMFAFVILDTLKMEIFGARDRFGIKPFYYYIDNTRFIFASDIPPIISILKNKRNANDSIIYDFLVFNRNDHSNLTFFQDINKLQHGHKFHLIKSKLTVNRWYNLAEKIQNNINSEYTSQHFSSDFSNSIDLQLRSDVPVGVCLSGGLDSSSITSMVQHKAINQSLNTFSAVYGNGIQGDESKFIDLYDGCGLKMHFTYPSAESLLSDMDHFNDAICEPIPNTSEYAEFKVMELARDHCTVILNGQGADEIMAGYHYFFGYFFKDLLNQFKLSRLTSELYHYLSIHKSFLGLQSFGFSLHPRLFKKKNTFLLNTDFVNRYSHTPNPIVDDFYTSSTLKEFLIKHFEYKFEHHLLWADKSGMYFSLETRFPFLDNRLVENTLASEITINQGWTKYLLREAMTGVIPDKICKRVDKVGYETPEMNWFKEPKFKEFFLDIIHSNSFKSRKFLNNTQCNKSLELYLKTGKYNSEFWKWLSLELWFRKYIDNV